MRKRILVLSITFVSVIAIALFCIKISEPKYHGTIITELESPYYASSMISTLEEADNFMQTYLSSWELEGNINSAVFTINDKKEYKEFSYMLISNKDNEINLTEITFDFKLQAITEFRHSILDEKNILLFDVLNKKQFLKMCHQVEENYSSNINDLEIFFYIENHQIIISESVTNNGKPVVEEINRITIHYFWNHYWI